MQYKVVKRSHVVTRGYLRGFALNERITMHLVGKPTARDIPVGDAGVLNNFYLRHRPDGTPIQDIEWSLEHVDRVAPPILREIKERWPLTVQEKAALAEFIAVQLVRGPRWREWHEAFTKGYFEDVRATGEFEGREPEGMTVEEALEETERLLSSDTERLLKMLEMSRKVTQIVGSMHWSLVEFERPWLVTSDHPVILWPKFMPSRQPKKSGDFVVGAILHTLEARFPVSPRHGLLMTWVDHDDDAAPILSSSKDNAANFNAFTVAEAVNQWFHLPSANPPIGSGQLLPIGPGLLEGGHDLIRSLRRDETIRRIQRKIGQPDAGAEIELVSVRATGDATNVGVALPAVDTDHDQTD
jgi:hypothetical protein